MERCNGHLANALLAAFASKAVVEGGESRWPALLLSMVVGVLISVATSEEPGRDQFLSKEAPSPGSSSPGFGHTVEVWVPERCLALV